MLELRHHRQSASIFCRRSLTKTSLHCVFTYIFLTSTDGFASSVESFGYLIGPGDRSNALCSVILVVSDEHLVGFFVKQSSHSVREIYRLELGIYTIFNPFRQCFNRSVPDSLICVGSLLRQIGAFRSSRRYCTRLRHRRMAWIVSKRRASIFLS